MTRASRDVNGRRLEGRTVVVTRSRHQASALVERLRDLGAEPVELPTVDIADPSDGGGGLRRAAARLAEYDWVVFTSANAVERLMTLVGPAAPAGPPRVAAIGPGTAAALARFGVRPDLVPERFVAESLLEAFPPPPRGGRVLLPRAAEARDVLPRGLSAAGWDVDVVEAYRTERPRPSPEALEAAARADAIAFTSSSTVRNYVEMAGLEALPPIVACIGPVTAATAREHGIPVATEAGVHTIDGLVEALAGVLEGTGP